MLLPLAFHLENHFQGYWKIQGWYSQSFTHHHLEDVSFRGIAWVAAVNNAIVFSISSSYVIIVFSHLKQRAIWESAVIANVIFSLITNDGINVVVVIRAESTI